MTRPCAACEGARYLWARKPCGWFLGQSAVCEACGGSGVVEERIPASDAIADSSTVTAMLPGIIWKLGEPDWDLWSSFDFWTGGLGLHEGDAAYYRRGASLLRRAVPGLRA